MAVASKAVYSFDVFDTCVTRHCAEPTDLFKALFTKLLAEAGVPIHGLETTAIKLARLRIEAESTARQQAQQHFGADDIALAKIYQQLAPDLDAHGLSAQAAIAEEIEIELAAVSPILSTRLQIQSLREQGHLIVFISDMYLPGSVVRQMLIEHGFTNGSDRVYVSADVGLSKGSGRLFTHVCQQLGIAPAQLHHSGDNLYADVQSARKQGVQASYFRQGDPTRYEKGFRAELLGNRWVASHLVGLSRAVRLRHDRGTPTAQRHAAIAADLIAPMLTGYVAWTLMSARNIGIKQLHFADEGLWAIARSIIQPWQQLDEYTQRHSIRSAPHHSLPECHLLVLPTDASSHTGSQQSDEASSWAMVTTGCPMTNELSDLVQQWHRRVRYGYHFSLLSSQQEDAPAHAPTHFAYLNAPLTHHRTLEGVAFLFEYRHILALLFSFVDAPSGDRDALHSYRAIALDYAATLARSPSLQEHLDMVKRYATRNTIAFLCAPTPADVRTLNELQVANSERQNRSSAKVERSLDRPRDQPIAQAKRRPQDKLRAQDKRRLLLIARPVRLWELPVISKQLVKRTSATAGDRAKENIRWIEGALASSSRFVQLLVKIMRWAYKVFSYRHFARRDRWFYQRH